MKTLSSTTLVRVRFSEIDSLRRVWHGSYVTYFEDGRERFGRKYPGIAYADMLREGIYAPIYDLHLRYLHPLAMDEEMTITTTFVYHIGARLDFEYVIKNAKTGELCCKGSSTQLFINSTGELITDLPEFFKVWQQRYLGTF